MKFLHVKLVIVIAAFGLAAMCDAKSLSDQASQGPGATVFPQLLGAYEYLSRYHSIDFSKKIDGCKSSAEFSRLEISLKKIGGDDLLNQIGFIDEQFIIPSGSSRFVIDVNKVRRNDGGQNSYSFITTPLVADGKFFVILSMSSPSRVTIFWIDKSLEGKLIYDSFRSDGGLPTFDDMAITSIGKVTAEADGSYHITEAVVPGGPSPRAFKLSLLPKPVLTELDDSAQ